MMTCPAKCPMNCPNFFTDSCPHSINDARVAIAKIGCKELPLQLHGSWEWFIHRQEIVAGKTPMCYVDDFRAQLDW